MNSQENRVVQMLQVSSIPVLGAAPKVWTPERIKALAKLNRTMRWLRSHQVIPLSVRLEMPRPAIVVQAMDEAILIAAGHGKSTMRLANGERHCSVILDGCTVQWEFRLHG